jgi:23S rRNA (guanosine2251-2'-O)-methyltransferase
LTTQTLYGLHAVRGLLERDPARVKKLRVAAGRVDPKVVQLLELAQRAGCVVQRVDPKIFERELAGAVHQGVVAEIEPMKTWGEDELVAALTAAKDPLVLVLDGVQDPHNLGACLRTADACGAIAVVVPRGR